MATIPYQELDIFIPEGVKAPSPREIPAGAGHTGTAVINRADLVTLAAGVLSRAATNANTLIAGYAAASELDGFKGGTAPYDAQLFGFGQGSAVIPQNLGMVIVHTLGVGAGTGLMLEINVSSTTGYQTGGAQQCDIGTTGGILLDPTTNLYVFDQTQANKILTLYMKVQGPGKGVSGDTGARFIAYVNTAAALV